MMTSSLTPVNNANQSYVAFLNLQTGKIISYLRNNYFVFTKYYFVLTKYYFVNLHIKKKVEHVTLGVP